MVGGLTWSDIDCFRSMFHLIRVLMIPSGVRSISLGVVGSCRRMLIDLVEHYLVECLSRRMFNLVECFTSSDVDQGYVGSPSFLRAVIDVHRRLKEANPDMLFICDPVSVD